MDLELRVLHAYWQHNLMSQSFKGVCTQEREFWCKAMHKMLVKGVERNDWYEIK